MSIECQSRLHQLIHFTLIDTQPWIPLVCLILNFVCHIVHEGRNIAGLKLDLDLPNRVSALTLLKTYNHRFVIVLFRILAAT